MTVALLESRLAPTAATRVTGQAATGLGVPGLRLIVLGRIACDEGATRPELARELSGVVAGVAGRLAIDTEVAQLVRAGMAAENRSRFTATSAGLAMLMDALALKALPKTWGEMRDIRLAARALGIEAPTPARIKGLADADTLRVEILSQKFGFKLRGQATAAKVRAALAIVALERAFGDKIKSELATGSDFNAKAARVLAGQLLTKPRDTGTDKRLVALLAAEAVGSPTPDGDALRTALLRQLAGTVTPVADPPAAGTPAQAPLPTTALAKPDKRVEAERVAKAPMPAPAARPAAAARPDLGGFVRIVQQLAGRSAEGWPGNRKALVSRVYAEIAAAHPGWGLTVVEFKAMLAECHRLGHLVLATADLKDKGQLDALRASAISYKNTVWHLIRVED